MKGFMRPKTHERKAHELKIHFMKVLKASKQLEGQTMSSDVEVVKSLNAGAQRQS